MMQRWKIAALALAAVALLALVMTDDSPDPPAVARDMDTLNDKQPLHHAAINGNEAEARNLLLLGADTEARCCTSDSTPLHIAAIRGHVGVARALLEAGADPNAKLNRLGNHETPLHRAAMNGHTTVVRLLIAGGADPDAKDSDGDVPGKFAEMMGYDAVDRALREARTN